MIDLTKIQKNDPKKMYKTYDNWPNYAREGYNSSQNLKKIKNVKHVVFCGMGGSGTIGEMFASILSKTNIHVSVVKGYLLPNTIDENSLIIVTSISGNTVETLTVLDSARKKKSRILAISSGGKMEKYCQKYQIDFRKIIQDHSPRASFTRFLFSLIKILEEILPLDSESVKNAIYELEKTKEKISSLNLSDSNPSLVIAKWITGIPLIYYPWGLNAAAIRFKNSLQENSKLHAISEDVIESCHNGIVAWEKTSDVCPILIEGEDDFEKTKERWKILKEYFKKEKIKFIEIHSIKGDILAKLINLIYILDYASIYHAILTNTDPSAIRSIDYIKKRL